MRLFSASILLSTFVCLASAESLRSYDERRLATKYEGNDSYQSKKAGSAKMDHAVDYEGSSSPKGSKKGVDDEGSYSTKKGGSDHPSSQKKDSKTSSRKSAKKGAKKDDLYNSKEGGSDHPNSGKNDSKMLSTKGNKEGYDYGDDYGYGGSSGDAYNTKKGGYDTYHSGKKGSKKGGSYGSKKGSKKGGHYADGDSTKGEDYEDSYNMKKSGYAYSDKKGSNKGGSYVEKGSKKSGDDDDDKDYGGSSKGGHDHDYGVKGSKSSSSKASDNGDEYDDYAKGTKGSSDYYMYGGTKDSKSLSSKGSKKGGAYEKYVDYTTATKGSSDYDSYGETIDNNPATSKGSKKGAYVSYDEAKYSDATAGYSTKTGKKGRDSEYGTKSGSSAKAGKKGSDCSSSKKSGSKKKSGKKSGSTRNSGKTGGDDNYGSEDTVGSEHEYYNTEMTGGSIKGSKKGKAVSGKDGGNDNYSSKKSKSSKHSTKGGYNGCDEEPRMPVGYPPAPVSPPPTAVPMDSGDLAPIEPEPAPVNSPTMPPPSPVAKPTMVPAPLPPKTDNPAPVAMPTKAPTKSVPSPVAKGTTVPAAESPVPAPAPYAAPLPEALPIAPSAAPESEPQPTVPEQGAAAPSSQPVAPGPQVSTGTILDVASEISALSTFVSLLSGPSQSDLYFTLLGKCKNGFELVVFLYHHSYSRRAYHVSGDGPFTIFAPSNEAISKLSRTVDITKLQTQAATFILAYHVFDHELRSDEIQDGFIVAFNGDGIYLNSTGGGVTLNGDINVVQADILASNGVIHVIDQVLLPPNHDVTDIAADNGLEQFLSALEVTGLSSVLQGDGPFTVFAPSDAAFAKLGQNTVDALFKDVTTLSNLMLYHVTSGFVGTGDLERLDSIETQAEGSPKITIKSSDGVLLNGNTRLTVANLLGMNGVVHLIDKVLIPPVMRSDSQQ